MKHLQKLALALSLGINKICETTKIIVEEVIKTISLVVVILCVSASVGAWVSFNAFNLHYTDECSKGGYKVDWFVFKHKGISYFFTARCPKYKEVKKNG